MEITKNKIIIEVSDSSSTQYEDACILRKVLNVTNRFDLFCTDGCYHRQDLDDMANYNFVFIDERSKGLCETIGNIFSDGKNKDKEICIAVHKSSRQIANINNKLTELMLNSVNNGASIATHKEAKEFNHENIYDLWFKGLLPLINSIKDKYKNYSQCYEKLWNLLTPSPVEIAHKLRSEILTPFTTIHLALQDSFDKNWVVKTQPLIFDKKCKKACEIIKEKELKEKLDAFLSYAESGDKSGINRKYAELKGRIEKLCEVIDNKNGLAQFKDLLEGKTGGNGLIEELAVALGKVVETVEHGEYLNAGGQLKYSRKRF